MITDLILNQFCPSIFCFATKEAKIKYPHYRSTLMEAFKEASKNLTFPVRLLFGHGIDKNVNFNDINEEFDEKNDEMLLESILISIRSCFSQLTSNLNSSSRSDLTYNEKVQKYRVIYDTIISSLFSRTRFLPYFFLPDIPVCLLIIIEGNESLQYPQGIFPPWSIANIRKAKKTTILLPPEVEPSNASEVQKRKNTVVSILTKWLKSSFLDQYSKEVTQVESDYVREWTGFTQAIANFFNARDDPKTSLVILKAYADLKAQKGNYKEAEFAYRKVCANVKEKEDEQMLAEALFLLGCVQIVESKNPVFFSDNSNLSNGQTNLHFLSNNSMILCNSVDLRETVSIFASARKHALAVGKIQQAFLCALFEFQVRRAVKIAPYRALMFIVSTNIGKDSIKIQNKPDIQFVDGFNTNSNFDFDESVLVTESGISILSHNSNTSNPNTSNSNASNSNISNSNTSNPNMSNSNTSNQNTSNSNTNNSNTSNSNTSNSNISNSNISNSNTNNSNTNNSNANNSNTNNSNTNNFDNSADNSNALVHSNHQHNYKFGSSIIPLCLVSNSSPFKYRAKGILRIILPFLLEMMSLFSRRRKRALFMTLAAHAFLIRRKRIISFTPSGNNKEIVRSFSDEINSDDENFGGFLDPFFCGSMLSDASELLQNEKWPLISQTISLRAISINENLVELLVSVVGSQKLMLPAQTIQVTNEFTHEEIQDDKISESNQSPLLCATASFSSGISLALPCGFIDTYVSDVYSHGFERCPPPSLRNKSEEWFSLSERMFGSFNNNNFFSRFYRRSSASSINAVGSVGGRRNLNSTSIYSGKNWHLKCECCVGEKVFIRVALKMRTIDYDLFNFSLLVNEFPVNEKGAESKNIHQTVIKSSLNLKATNFCFVECSLSPQIPGRYEVYGVKFEWGNVAHLECPFNEQDPVIVIALPEYSAPHILLQVLPKQHVIPSPETQNNELRSLTKINKNKRICISNSSINFTESTKLTLTPGQIFPLTIRITNTCNFDIPSISMLIYSSGPIECVLIEPQIKGIFGRYSLPKLNKGESFVLDIAVRSLHDQEIEKDSNNITNINSDQADVLVLFPFWTSPSDCNNDVFLPVPRFDFVELNFDIIGRKKKRSPKPKIVGSKSNNSISSIEPKQNKIKKHSLLNISIERIDENTISGVSISCPPKTFALGFSPFENNVIQNHSFILNENSAILNIASFCKKEKNDSIKLPSFCRPFVPNDKIVFWFTDNESVFYCYVEDELKKQEKIKLKKKIKQNKISNENKLYSNRFNSECSIVDELNLCNSAHKNKNSSMFSFLGGIEVSVYFDENNNLSSKFNSKKLLIFVKNVTGFDLNNVSVELVQKKNDDFVQSILCGKLKNCSKVLKNNDSVNFTLNALLLSSSIYIKVSVVSDTTKVLLPINISL